MKVKALSSGQRKGIIGAAVNFKLYFMSITLFGILTVVGFFSAGFLLWKTAGEEHLPPSEAFDILIGSALWALVAARAAAVILQFDRFGWNPLRWLSLFYLPGLNGPAALLIGILMIYAGSIRRNWNRWTALDVFSPALMIWQALMIVLYSWPTALFWMGWSVFLLFAGEKYRLWEWYRGRHGDAKPGLVFALWMIGLGIGFNLLILHKISIIFSVIPGVAFILFGVTIAYIRAGRRIRFKKP